MFDTMRIARTIRDARISRNMTQMNLADAMQVSYQAVSNWERGNSMPDIAKLEQLCQVLGIKLEDLLGTEKATQTITKVLEGSPSALTKTIYRDSGLAGDADMAPAAEDIVPDTEPMTVEEICDIAPLLPPNNIEALVENNLHQTLEKVNFSSISALAPFLDTKYLDNLVQKASFDSLGEITCIAPFLSTGTLDSLVMNFDSECDINGLCSLAPFLSHEALNSLALDKLRPGSLMKLAGLAPFLSRETLDTLIDRADPECDMPGICSLAPFLSHEALDSLVLDRLQLSSLTQLAGLAPFLSKETLNTLVNRANPEYDMPGISALAPFLSKKTLGELVGKYIADGISDRKISCLFPFLSQDALQNIAQAFMTKNS